MFRRGRRRKPRVQWLPVPGTLLDQTGNAPTVSATENPGVIEFIVDTQADVPQTVGAPMVVDNPTTETVAGAPLSVYQTLALNQTEQFGYRLRRIVGDIAVSAATLNTQANTPVAGVLCTAGISVARCDDTTGLLIGGVRDQNIIQNNADPFIWRRTWLLGTGNQADAQRTLAAISRFPRTNADYGSKWSAGVDQKTARRIGPEERLFFFLTVEQLPINNTATNGVNITDDNVRVYCLFDYRVLASVFTSAGNRRNASR